ncbi:ribonuclease HI [Caballeronia sp. PC1]|uniref:ribonuclease HI n=1 Tax=Caballeronia sp. PC1 TaxID=2906765 RepID=UPI00025BAD5D
MYLANEQCALETSTPIVRSVGFSGEISTKCFAVYSDGSTIRNPGPSGCGWVVMNEGEVVHEGFKAIGYATNQIAEIRAAAYGLNDLPEGATVEVFTDSLYVVKTMRGQYRKKTNLEHWQCLADAVGRHASVTFHHVRGHAGHQVNERADRLARKASSEAEQDARDAMS